MPPRRNYAAPRRASKSSTLPKLQHMTTTIRSAALRAWKNSPSRNIYLGGAAMIAVIAVFMRHFLSPTFPIPSKGVVLVTGTSSGIGREVVILLANKGYHVFAGVRRQEDFNKWRGFVNRHQGSYNVIPVMLDVRSKKNIDDATTEVENYLRERSNLRFSGLVNNCGRGYHMPLEHHDMNDVRDMFETNLLGPLALTQKLLPLIRRDKGRVVFTSSLAGRITQPKEGIYSATKVGMEAIGDALRQELLPYECSVSLVEPGFVLTPILSKILESEEIGNSTLAARTYPRYYTSKYFSIFKKGIEMAGHVSQPAHKILAALTDAKPKTRYTATNFMSIPTWAAIRVKEIIPDRLFDKIVA